MTEIRSTSTVFGSASSRVALSSLPTPIAFAKSSPVPAGNTANVAPVPTNPFTTRLTLPSPPRTATMPPCSPAARASDPISSAEPETRISWSTPISSRIALTRPISRPALPSPAVGIRHHDDRSGGGHGPRLYEAAPDAPDGPVRLWSGESKIWTDPSAF